MNVYDSLQKDHRDVLELFRQLKAPDAGPSEEKARLFERLSRELTVHMAVEEKYFYSHINGAGKSHGKGLHAEEEHRVARLLLAQLASGGMDTEEWATRLRILEHNIELHILEEEERVFPKARRMLSKAEAEVLGLEMEEHKSRYLALEG